MAKAKTIVIGIDPGTNGGGHAIMIYPEDVTQEPELIQCGELVAPTDTDIFGKVTSIVSAILDIVNEYKSNDVIIVCERYFAAVRRMSGAMALPYLIGHLGATCHAQPIPFHLANMMSWKKFLGIKGNATKDQVRAAVAKKYELETNLKQHVYDAIGIAYFYKSILEG